VEMVEEARDGLREPAAVVGVGDEVAPRAADALATAERPHRQARQDLHDEVVREVGRRRKLAVVHPGRRTRETDRLFGNCSRVER
jgi:hypothetical protein